MNVHMQIIENLQDQLKIANDKIFNASVREELLVKELSVEVEKIAELQAEVKRLKQIFILDRRIYE